MNREANAHSESASGSPLPPQRANGTDLKSVAEAIGGNGRAKLLADIERLGAELSSKSTFLETVFEQMPAGVFIAEAHSGKIIFANKHVSEILGRPLFPIKSIDDLLNTAAWRSNGQALVANDRPVIRSLKNGETIKDEELRYTLADGSPRVVIINASPVHDTQGRIIAAIMVLQDVTEKKRVEAELRRHKRNLEALVSERSVELKIANERLEKELAWHKKAQDEISQLSQFRETVIDSADIWLLVADESGNIVIWNRAAEKISGYSRQEVVGSKKPWLLLYPDPKYRKDIGELFLSVMTEGKIAEDFETVICTKSGANKTISWNAKALAGPGGKRLGLMAVGRDITERKELDAKMHRYQRQLRSLASQMSLTEEQLRRRIASELHDGLGQLLAISKMKLGQFRKSAAEAGLAGQLDEIQQLVEKSIGYTRSLTVELSPPVLYELGFEAALEWLCEQIQKQHNIKCTFKSLGPPESLDSNSGIVLFQIIRELMHNIAKHSQACTAYISVDTIGQDIRIEVVDDGVGFDMHEVSSRPDHAGGFGLFNIRERLGHLGGRLEVSSTAGRGTCVTVIAPMKSA